MVLNIKFNSFGVFIFNMYCTYTYRMYFPSLGGNTVLQLDRMMRHQVDKRDGYDRSTLSRKNANRTLIVNFGMKHQLYSLFSL